MLDVVANHMGENVPISQLNPFNQSEHFHRCVICPSNCQINDYTVLALLSSPSSSLAMISSSYLSGLVKCFRPEVQQCKLAGLPDLNQTVQSPLVLQLCLWTP